MVHERRISNDSKKPITGNGWGSTYNPFFGFKRLSTESDAYEKIFPFSLEEQSRLVACLPSHWQPYFLFAFRSGLRQDEQIGLKPGDIDWDKKLIHVRRAITLDEAGKVIEGMKQTRHSFATLALSCGEDPLWRAKVMGHRNVDMIIRVYGKHAENSHGSKDGHIFDSIYKKRVNGNDE